MSEPFLVYDSQLSPSPADTLTSLVAGSRDPFDFTDCTVAFSMRPSGSATLKVDHATAVIVGDPTDGNWRYDWAAGDTDTSGVGGPYRGFLTVTLPSGKDQDTPEFDIEIAVHAGAASPLLCSVDDVRQFLKKQPTDTADDEVLQTLIAAVSDAITNYCSRQFTPDAANPRSHRFRSSHRMVDLAPYDLQAAATVTLNPESSSPMGLTAWTDYELLPIDGDANVGTFYILKLYRHLTCRSHYIVDIDGTWGAASVPPIVRQAAYVTTAEWYRSKVAAFSTVFNDEGVHVAPAPLPTMVCGWLDAFKRHPQA